MVGQGLYTVKPYTAKNMTQDLGQDLALSPSLGLGAKHDPSLGSSDPRLGSSVYGIERAIYEICEIYITLAVINGNHRYQDVVWRV